MATHRFLSVERVAKLARVTRGQVAKHARAGRIPDVGLSPDGYHREYRDTPGLRGWCRDMRARRQAQAREKRQREIEVEVAQAKTAAIVAAVEKLARKSPELALALMYAAALESAGALTPILQRRGLVFRQVREAVGKMKPGERRGFIAECQWVYFNDVLGYRRGAEVLTAALLEIAPARLRGLLAKAAVRLS
jgi:hypothetical protein